MRGNPVGGGSRRPTAAEIAASEVALGARFPNSYLYVCLTAASLLDDLFKLPVGDPPAIVRHNRMLREAGHPTHLISFSQTDDGDYCFDTSVGRGPREYPIVYVDHWSSSSQPTADPFARSFLDWLVQVLEHDIRMRREALDGWAEWLRRS